MWQTCSYSTRSVLSTMPDKSASYLLEHMREALGSHPQVGEVRGDGLLCAVELVADRDDRVFHDPDAKVGASVAAAMLQRGVICRAMPQGDILGFRTAAVPHSGRSRYPGESDLRGD